MNNRTNYAICEAANQLNLRLLTFGRAVVDSRWNNQNTSLPFSSLWLVTSGSFYVQLADGERIELKEGSGYLVPAGVNFAYGCSNEMEHFYFQFKLCGSDEIDLLSRCNEAVCCLGPVEQEMLAGLSAIRESRDPVDGLWLKSELYKMIRQCVKQYQIHLEEKTYSPCVARAMVYIQTHLSASLKVEDIAAYSYVARSTLTKHFRQEVGMPLTEYTFELLMAEACRLLSGSQMSIASIAERLGFSDQFYFAKRFKYRFNKRPSEYRKRVTM